MQSDRAGALAKRKATVGAGAIWGIRLSTQKRSCIIHTREKIINHNLLLCVAIHVKVLCSLVYQWIVGKIVANQTSLGPLHANHSFGFVALSEATGRISSIKMELMLSLTLGHLSEKMFWEQRCFSRTKEGLEVLKSCVNKTVFVWPAAARTLYGRDYSIVWRFCSGMHLQPPSSAFPLDLMEPCECSTWGREMGCVRCCWLRLCCCQFSLFI